MSHWRAFSVPGLHGVCLWLGMLACLAPNLVSADMEIQHINKVKAAFVLNIARFVTWPAEVFEGQEGRLLLCVYRTNPFAEALDSIRGKTVGGRQLEISRVENLSDSESCHILLISQLELKVFSEEAHPDLTRALLTVADMTDATTEPTIGEGVLVNLVRKGTHIKFEIDLGKARGAGLMMSSELLKHARIVGEER